MESNEEPFLNYVDELDSEDDRIHNFFCVLRASLNIGENLNCFLNQLMDKFRLVLLTTYFKLNDKFILGVFKLIKESFFISVSSRYICVEKVYACSSFLQLDVTATI